MTLDAFLDRHPRITYVLGVIILTAPLWAPFVIGSPS